MAALRLGLFLLFVLVHAVCFLPHGVHCGDEDDLLQGLNSYRSSKNVPLLLKNHNAKCMAEKIAENLEDEKCNSTNGVNAPIVSQQKLATEKVTKKCKIMANSTTDGVILSVCVDKLVPALVFTNFTYTPKYARILKSANYTGAGLGCSDDWMVLVLTTNTSTGNFNSAAYSLVSKVGLGYNVVALMVGLVVYLVSLN